MNHEPLVVLLRISHDLLPRSETGRCEGLHALRTLEEEQVSNWALSVCRNMGRKKSAMPA